MLPPHWWLFRYTFVDHGLLLTQNAKPTFRILEHEAIEFAFLFHLLVGRRKVFPGSSECKAGPRGWICVEREGLVLKLQITVLNCALLRWMI